jgi:hypothetical protein
VLKRQSYFGESQHDCLVGGASRDIGLHD